MTSICGYIIWVTKLFNRYITNFNPKLSVPPSVNVLHWILGGISPSPTRSGASIPGATSRSRGRSNGSGNEQSSRASSAKSPGAKPPIVPTLASGGGKATGSSRPKSLVRDTIRLFDAKSRNRIPLSGGAVVGKHSC